MDASASGADEIGKAMQKAGATATEAGLSFEWLGAYIATISERTRQAPEVIGTSLNAIMSRLQSIKQKGYNEEDETQINDIAKALRNIDVAIMDNEGNWRDMSDIFMDIALQWEDLDDKTRSYIATTMAGTRQKNYFLSLMNDMKNVASTTGEVSRAMELYEGAMNSAGSAAEKYKIYQESVTAAHDRMKASLDQIYSLFGSNVLKGFYNMVGDIADGIYGLFDDTTDYTSTISYFQDQSSWIQSLRDEYVELNNTKTRTKKQDERMIEILNQLTGGNRNLATAIGNAETGYVDAETAVKAMNTELERNLELFRQYSQFSLRDVINDTEELGKALQEWKEANESPDLQKIFALGAEAYGMDIYSKDPENAFDENKAERLVKNIQSIWQRGTQGTLSNSIEKQIYDMFHPDGIADSDLYVAWGTFLDDFKGNLVKGIHSLDISTSDAAAAKVEEELSKKTSYVIENILYGKNFASLPEKIKSNVYNLTKEIVAGINEADWSQGEQHLTDLIVTETNKRVNDYVNMMNQARDLFKITGLYKEEDINAARSGDHGNQLQDLQHTIDAYNLLHGTTYSLTGVMKAAIDPASDFGDAIKNNGEKAKVTMMQLEDLWESISSGAKKWRISQKTAENWMPELEQMVKHLQDGRLDKIVSGWESMDSDYRAAMREDIEWIDQFLELVSKGDRVGALEFISEQMAGMDDAATNLKESLKEVREELAIEDAKKSDFADQRSALAKFLPNTESGEFDRTGLLDYISGLDEKMLEALYEFYPPLEKALALLDSTDLSQQQEGAKLFTEAILAMGDAWTVYAEKYREAQELEIDDDEGLEIMQNLGKELNTKGIEGYQEAFVKLTKEEQEWVEANSKAHKKIAKSWDKGEDGIKDNTKEIKKFNRELKKLELDKLAESGEIWEEVADIADEGVDTEEELIQAYGAFQDRLDKIVEAQGDLNFVMSATDKTTDDYTDAISNLESVCGFAIDSEQDLALAQMFLASQMDTATMSSSTLLNYLMGITGSTFNAASWETELAALAASGDSAAICMQNLIANIRAVDGARINYSNGVFNVSGLGSAAIRRSGSSGGRSSGGGGGGGSDTSNEMSEIEKMLELMEKIQDLREHQMDLIEANRSYYEESGYLTSVIKSYEEERDAIEDNNKVIEENLRKIESILPAKQKEVAAMSTSAKEYEQAKSDLEALQEAHQDYTLQLLENKTAVEEQTNSIKEQENEIRDMEIELRETILEAIEDREELNERMLQGRIDVENEILDVITARYEKERDLAIETAEAKIEALEAESEALDDQLQKRREMAEQEDKQAQLAQLQAKLARISADPTRRKEELGLRRQIEELREEMAWDLAEQEVEAQQEALDQQITSLEDYIEYVEEYYEDLFEHPQKLIEEMKMIISKTDEEIIEWLKKNSEDYAASTEATQQDMVNSWNEMLMDMHGSIETYWDEIEQIIAGGDEAIIAFLKEHSADYKEAGKLQAEAYVDEWKKQLEALAKAHEDIYKKTQSYDYSIPAPSTGSSSSSGGTGGGGGPRYITDDMVTRTDQYDSLDNLLTYYYHNGRRVVKAKAPDGNFHWKYFGTSDFATYAKGGLANFTGPAWLDGTKSAPERILSPYQTKLFEDMIATLHMIKVQVPSMPASMFSPDTSAQGYSVGDIIVNVESLQSDEDYRDMAERVMEEIMTRVTRGAAVGGIRITR